MVGLMGNPYILACIVAVLSLLLYGNTLWHDWTFDDYAAITRNPVVTGDVGWGQLLVRDFWGTSTRSTLSHKSYRPLTSALYRILWLIGPSSAPVFHVVIVVLNAVVSAAAVLAVLGSECSPLVRVVAALLYACHPVKTEAVAGLVGMAEVLSGGISFGAFYAATTGHPILAGLLCFLSGMAKETGVFSALVISVYYFQQRNRAHRIRRSIMVSFVAFTLFFGARYLVFGKESWSIEPSWQDNPMMLQKGFMWFVNAIVVQVEYLRILAFPLWLSCDYSFNAFPLATSIFSVQVAVALLVAGVFLWLAWRALRIRELFFAFSWYVAPMIPATHLVVIGTLVAERLLYVPLLGWSIAVGVLCKRASGNSKGRQLVALVVVIFLCAALAYRGVERNRDWKTQTVLFHRTAEDVPGSVKAWMQLAALSFSENKNHSAVLEYTDRVLAIDPEYCSAYQMRGRSWIDSSGAPDALDQAEKLYNRTLSCMLVKRHSSKILAELYEGLGIIQMRRNNYAAAIAPLSKALAGGDHEDVTCNLSVVYYKLDRLQESLPLSWRCVKSGDQASRLDTVAARYSAATKVRNHAYLMRDLKEWDHCIRFFERSMELDPRHRYDEEVQFCRGHGKK